MKLRRVYNEKKNYVGKAVMLGALSAYWATYGICVSRWLLSKSNEVLTLQILQTGLLAHRNKLQII